MTSDYEDFIDPTREQAEEIVCHAEAFLAEAKVVWERLRTLR